MTQSNSNTQDAGGRPNTTTSDNPDQLLQELNELAVEHKRLAGRHRRAGRELRQKVDAIKDRLARLGIKMVE